MSSHALSRTRHRARELALQTLYACEIGRTPEWEDVLRRIADGDSFTEESVRYARELVRETMASRGTIDEAITLHASNWELKRMAALDRNILRLAAAELFYFGGVPFRVVIDEAVELAKTYGTGESGGFVNGILDSIHKSRVKETERKAC
ncbi:MAG: transcription antitermination factor NusB [Chitinispirillaceae bacterium]|nr:transcription antitermination factor NusB [Chitinispirillaceae bacterium]